tara:strand:+ start:533 stop:700 length:168 start_codon:yes stop_codon:yes gene_type:complete
MFARETAVKVLKNVRLNQYVNKLKGAANLTNDLKSQKNCIIAGPENGGQLLGVGQ